MNPGLVSKRRFRKALLKLGFVEERGKAHIHLDFYHEGRVVVHTQLSHGGGKDISRGLLSYILRWQLYMTKDEFSRALRGDLSRDEYLEILSRKGII